MRKPNDTIAHSTAVQHAQSMRALSICRALGSDRAQCGLCGKECEVPMILRFGTASPAIDQRARRHCRSAASYQKHGYCRRSIAASSTSDLWLQLTCHCPQGSMPVLLGVLLKFVQRKERGRGVCPVTMPAVKAATPSERVATEPPSMHSATRPERHAQTAPTRAMVQICNRNDGKRHTELQSRRSGLRAPSFPSTPWVVV